MYADVIIDISHEQLDKTFQYAVPDELVDVIELGMSVDIPFGAGNRQITGYVVGLGDKAAYPVEKIKYPVHPEWKPPRLVPMHYPGRKVPPVFFYS